MTDLRNMELEAVGGGKCYGIYSGGTSGGGSCWLCIGSSSPQGYGWCLGYSD